LYEKYSKSEHTKDAIVFSLEGDFVKALHSYDEALDMLESIDEANSYPQFEVCSAQYFILTLIQIDLWEDERLSCLERLGKVEALYDNILANVDGNEMNLWNISYFSSKDAQVYQSSPECQFEPLNI
jgi:tetratricopeptide (TPR) repeat protein